MSSLESLTEVILKFRSEKDCDFPLYIMIDASVAQQNKSKYLNHAKRRLLLNMSKNVESTWVLNAIVL